MIVLLLIVTWFNSEAFAQSRWAIPISPKAAMRLRLDGVYHYSGGEQADYPASGFVRLVGSGHTLYILEEAVWGEEYEGALGTFSQPPTLRKIDYRMSSGLGVRHRGVLPEWGYLFFEDAPQGLIGRLERFHALIGGDKIRAQVARYHEGGFLILLSDVPIHLHQDHAAGPEGVTTIKLEPLAQYIKFQQRRIENQLAKFLGVTDSKPSFVSWDQDAGVLNIDMSWNPQALARQQFPQALARVQFPQERFGDHSVADLPYRLVCEKLLDLGGLSGL